jgi:tRNA nucleotidyltransferase/poly(A) polymerase
MIKIILNENLYNELASINEAFSPEYDKFKELFRSAPKELQKRFMGNWNVKQRKDFHPEGNTLKHMMIVTKRAMSMYPNDIDMILAAFFHDIGKDEVYAMNPKTGEPTAFDHEKVSGELVMKYKDWVEEQGGNPERVKAIVDGHMKVKKMDEMTPKKAAALQSSEYFPDLVKFRFIDRGGLPILKVPAVVKKLVLDFNKNGHEMYVVGGAIRDMFYGKKPKDFDLATDATPDRIMEVLEKEGYEDFSPIGTVFLAIGVKLGGELYEIATFREDGTYTDQKRPDTVRFADIETDAKRRDLTMNALYYDVINDKVIDIVGAVEDIAKDRVRTVGSAKDRFGEDRSRVLRAIRFAARTGSDLDEDIKKEIKRDNSLTNVSYAKMQEEFVKSVKESKSPKYYLGMLSEYDLFPEMFPGLKTNTDFLDIKNADIALAQLLKDNNSDDVYNTLNKINYGKERARKVKLLIDLKTLSPETAMELKNKANSYSMDAQTMELFMKYGLKLNSRLIRAFIQYEPSVRGGDIIKQYNVTGKQLGDKIKELETELFKELM